MQLNAYFRPEEYSGWGEWWGVERVGCSDGTSALPPFCCLIEPMSSSRGGSRFEGARAIRLKQRTKEFFQKCLKETSAKRTHAHERERNPQGNNKFAAMRNGNVCNGNRGNAAEWSAVATAAKPEAGAGSYAIAGAVGAMAVAKVAVVLCNCRTANGKQTK